ncbi:DMT family transporter [Neorhizobium sp. DAR64861/K0K2]|uniref:DMT family transporter n=1 Tax=unclassified Neorhizobium TaxID=2629175 RepID=UPI003D2E3F9B
MPNLSLAESGQPSAPASQVGKGVALMLLAVMFIALIDPAAKYASRHLPVLQVVWARYAFGCLTAFALFRPSLDPRRWGIRRPGLQALRAACLFGSTAFNFLALRDMGLVENQAIVMLGPVVITALSILLFRERLQLLVGLGLLLGLVGALLVIQPGADVFKLSAVYAVGNVLSYAFYVLLSKRLLSTESMLSLNIVAVALPAIVLSIAVVPIWQWPDDSSGWVAMVLVGIIGGLGHFFLVVAHRHAPASTLAPLAYTQLCWALAGGLLIFAELPDLHTVAGAVVVLASGAVVMASGRR